MALSGLRYGIDVTGAEFRPYKDFRAQWRGKKRSFAYGITDYVSDAPDSALFAFTDTVVARSAGLRKEYGAEYYEWVSSSRFVKEKRPVYIARSRNITESPVGKFRNLAESADRLVSAGFVDGSVLEDSFLTWTKRPGYTKVGSCNTMFRLISVSSSLDSADVPREVLDYVMYHECLHLSRGYLPEKRHHDSEFRKAEKLFPSWEESERFLRKMRRNR